jgi:hypothetical protein
VKVLGMYGIFDDGSLFFSRHVVGNAQHAANLELYIYTAPRPLTPTVGFRTKYIDAVFKSLI